MDYSQSGLSNVQLQNVPVWICPNDHEEVQIPATTQLHELLAQVIIRKPSTLDGSEVKFLRRRIDQSAKEFAQKIGITPVHLSRVENGTRPITRPVDLLVRLTVAAYIAARDGKTFPKDLVTLIDQLERSWDIGAHRLKHVSSAPPESEWEEAGM